MLKSLERSSFIKCEEIRGHQTTYYLIDDDKQCGYAKASKHVRKQYSQGSLTGKEIYKCHVGVVLTNQYFTLGTKELAKATDVLLWDRDELQRMIASCL